MRKLYWKIFIWFWLAMCLTIVMVAWVSSEVTQNSASVEEDQHTFISSVSAAAIIMINSGNKAQFQEWNNYLQEHYGIQFMLLPLSVPAADEENHDFIHIINKVQRTDFSLDEVTAPPFVISQPFISVDGSRYRLIAKLPEDVFERYRFNRGNIIFRFSAAILISGFICYLLSLYLLRPIRVLQRAARKLGQGELQTRVRSTLGQRKDEIGELADDFDEMAARLGAILHSKQQLLQDISHELRSPLARLSVALEIARDKSPQSEKELIRIGIEAEKLNDLIQQILSLSSMDGAPHRLTFEMIDLVELIESIVSDANYEMQQRSRPIQFIAPFVCEASVNYILLRSAIENVIRNALRYTPLDRPITVRLEVMEEAIKIIVEDSGLGIPEENLVQVFDPFFRVDDSRTQQTGGFGLGLTIAKRAILLHHGTIHAENLPECGLRVVLTLPKKHA